MILLLFACSGRVSELPIKRFSDFELNSFFNTYLVALLIIVIESILHSFISIL